MFTLNSRIEPVTRILLITAVLFNALTPTVFAEAKTASVSSTKTNSQVAEQGTRSIPASEQSESRKEETVSDSISRNIDDSPLTDSTVQTAHQPIVFFENVGQYDPRALFVAQGKSGSIFLAENEIWFTFVQQVDKNKEKTRQGVPDDLREPDKDELVDVVSIKLVFPGSASKVRGEGFNKLDMRVSRFSANNSSSVYQDIPVWQGVRYVDLYPGADLEITSQNGELAWQLVVKDSLKFSAKESTITRQGMSIKFAGQNGLSVSNGKMSIETDFGEYVFPELKIRGANNQKRFDGSPKTQGDEFFLIPPSTSSFEFNQKGSGVMASVVDTGEAHSPASNNANRDFPASVLLGVIFGGSGADFGEAQTLAPDGSVLVAGSTDSIDFPQVAGSYQEELSGGNDAFVTKLDALDGHII